MIDDDYHRVESEPHRRLIAAIETFSEEHWSAAWHIGVEWVLLDLLEGRIGPFVSLEAELADLRSIRAECGGGWVAWKPGEGAVPVAPEDIEKARAAWEFAP